MVPRAGVLGPGEPGPLVGRVPQTVPSLMLVVGTQNSSPSSSFSITRLPCSPRRPFAGTWTFSSVLLGVRLSFSPSLSSMCPRPETSVFLRASQSHRPTSSAHTSILRLLPLYRDATRDAGLTQQLFVRAQLIPSWGAPTPSANSHSLVWSHHCPFLARPVLSVDL